MLSVIEVNIDNTRCNTMTNVNIFLVCQILFAKVYHKLHVISQTRNVLERYIISTNLWNSIYNVQNF